MKSKSHILILLLVSMMITYVGAGQLVAQCRHTGMVEAIDAHDSCNGCCHKQQKKCITLSVKKISSAVGQQHVSVESPTPSDLPLALLTDFFAATRHVELPKEFATGESKKIATTAVSIIHSSASDLAVRLQAGGNAPALLSKYRNN